MLLYSDVHALFEQFFHAIPMNFGSLRQVPRPLYSSNTKLKSDTVIK